MSGDAGNDRSKVSTARTNCSEKKATDNLIGGAGNDTLHGGSGNNMLEGGLGADRLEGNGGLSLAYYHNAATGVQVFLTRTAEQNTGEASGDTFDGVLGIQGSIYDDVLVGDARPQLSVRRGRQRHAERRRGRRRSISGGKGDDTLWGRNGRRHARRRRRRQPPDRRGWRGHVRRHRRVERRILRDVHQLGPGATSEFRPTMEGMLSATAISTSTPSSVPHTTTR